MVWFIIGCVFWNWLKKIEKIVSKLPFFGLFWPAKCAQIARKSEKNQKKSIKILKKYWIFLGTFRTWMRRRRVFLCCYTNFREKATFDKSGQNGVKWLKSGKNDIKSLKIRFLDLWSNLLQYFSLEAYFETDFKIWKNSFKIALFWPAKYAQIARKSEKNQEKSEKINKNIKKILEFV